MQKTTWATAVVQFTLMEDWAWVAAVEIKKGQVGVSIKMRSSRIKYLIEHRTGCYLREKGN